MRDNWWTCEVLGFLEVDTNVGLHCEILVPESWELFCFFWKFSVRMTVVMVSVTVDTTQHNTT